MKSTIVINLIIVICTVFLLGCTNLETAGTQSKELPKNEQALNTKTPPTEKASQDGDIRSRDFKTAANALEKAVKEKDAAIVKLGLQSPILSIRLKTSEAIKQLDDVVFVPNLIEALDENQSMMDGGTETQMMQIDLSKSLVANLEQLTKMKFAVSEKPTFEEIQEVVKRSREWSKANQVKQK